MGVKIPRTFYSPTDPILHKILGFFRKFWPILANFQKIWPIFQKFWTISRNFGQFWPKLDKLPEKIPDVHPNFMDKHILNTSCRGVNNYIWRIWWITSQHHFRLGDHLFYLGPPQKCWAKMSKTSTLSWFGKIVKIDLVLPRLQGGHFSHFLGFWKWSKCTFWVTREIQSAWPEIRLYVPRVSPTSNKVSLYVPDIQCSCNDCS